LLETETVRILITKAQSESKHLSIEARVKEAIAFVLKRHKRLGESIALKKDSQVVILPPEEIPVNIDNSKENLS
jgi:hypothetical protein